MKYLVFEKAIKHNYLGNIHYPIVKVFHEQIKRGHLYRLSTCGQWSLSYDLWVYLGRTLPFDMMMKKKQWKTYIRQILKKKERKI